jgi:hypothetical protein
MNGISGFAEGVTVSGEPMPFKLGDEIAVFVFLQVGQLLLCQIPVRESPFFHWKPVLTRNPASKLKAAPGCVLALFAVFAKAVWEQGSILISSPYPSSPR